MANEIAAPATAITAPAELLLWSSFALIVAAVVLPWVLRDRRVQRRIYWSGWIIGCAGTAVAVSERDGWRTALLAAGCIMLAGIVIAIRYTDYLKIGGRTVGDTPEPRSSQHRTPRRRLSAEDVRTQMFSTPPVGKRGYNPGQVDAFMETIAQHLDGHAQVTPDNVRDVCFGTPPPLARGYDPHQVDEFLDNVIETLSDPTGSAPHAKEQSS